MSTAFKLARQLLQKWWFFSLQNSSWSINFILWYNMLAVLLRLLLYHRTTSRSSSIIIRSISGKTKIKTKPKEKRSRNEGEKRHHHIVYLMENWYANVHLMWIKFLFELMRQMPSIDSKIEIKVQKFFLQPRMHWMCIPLHHHKKTAW